RRELDFRQLRAVKDAHEWRLSECFVPDMVNIFTGHARLQPDVNRRKNPAVDRQQVRREDERIGGAADAKALRDFGLVAVTKDVVGFEALADFDEVRPGRGSLARAGHAGLESAMIGWPLATTPALI